MCAILLSSPGILYYWRLISRADLSALLGERRDDLRACLGGLCATWRRSIQSLSISGKAQPRRKSSMSEPEHVPLP